MTDVEGNSKRFEPKVPVKLAPPKDDLYTIEDLSKADGTDPNGETWVAIKGTIFDVKPSAAYAPGGRYHVFTGKDSSRALASSSLELADCRSDWQDLDDEKQKILNDWYTYFSKRYNIVGKVQL